jgi:dihydroorotase
LRAGSLGDVTLFSVDSEWVYDVNETRSRSRNCPFHGMKLKGQVAGTIVAGRIVYRNDVLLSVAGN